MRRPCYKDIAFGPKNMGLDEAEIDERVHESSRRFVGLDEALLERSPFELSGGQKRRVAIAGVHGHEARASWCWTSPPRAWTPRAGMRSWARCKSYHKKTGTTVLLVSHSMEDIAKYADRVLVMYQQEASPCTTRWRTCLPGLRSCWSWASRVPQVTKIFLQAAGDGSWTCPADVYTIPYAVKTVLAAKARRDAGSLLYCPGMRRTGKGACPDAERYHHWPALPGQQPCAQI